MVYLPQKVQQFMIHKYTHSKNKPTEVGCHESVNSLCTASLYIVNIAVVVLAEHYTSYKADNRLINLHNKRIMLIIRNEPVSTR